MVSGRLEQTLLNISQLVGTAKYFVSFHCYLQTPVNNIMHAYVCACAEEYETKGDGDMRIINRANMTRKRKDNGT